MKFNNVNSLMRHIEKQAKHALELMARDVETEMKNYIMQELYQAYQPHEYVRTYDYINSLTVSKVTKVGNKYQVRVYFDSNKIRLNETDGYWNQHMSLNGDDTWDGKPLSELIPYFIEYGVTGSKWDRDGIEVVKKTIEDTVKLVGMIQKHLKSKGFNVVIK